ncbi:MFS transporter, partial [bacterium]|nr:MFS transporter [bacterium]
ESEFRFKVKHTLRTIFFWVAFYSAQIQRWSNMTTMHLSDASPKEASTHSLGNTNAKFILIITTLLYTINYMDRMVLSVTLPLIKAEFGFSDAQCGWLGTIYFLFTAMMIIPVAVIVDKWSRKKTISLMAAVWSIGTFFTGIGSSFVQLMFSRGIVGMGEAGFVPGGTAYISGSFKESVRAKVLGVFTSGSTLGMLLGIILAGHVAQANYFNLGWRLPYFLFAIPGVILGILILFTRDFPNQASRDVVDKGMSGQVKQEILSLLKKPAFILCAIGLACAGFSVTATVHWYPTYLMRTWGIETAKASSMFGLIMACSIPAPIIVGAIADRWKIKRDNARVLTAAVFLLLSAIGYLLALTLDLQGKNGFGYAIFIFNIFAISGAVAPVYSITQDLAPPALRGISMGLMLLITYGTLGGYAPTIIGWISDIMGTVGQPDLQKAFLFIPIPLFMGAIIFFAAARLVEGKSADNRVL